MKKLYIILFTALTLFACTPAPKEKPSPKTSDPAKAPQVVSTIPAANATSADIVEEIVIVYDKDITLAPRTTISVNGIYYDDAVSVTGKELHIPVSLKGSTEYTVNVLSPSVKDSEGNYAQDYSFSFRTVVRNNFNSAAFSIDDSPADPAATAGAKALYAQLKKDFGQKTYSATMAEVDWNYDNAKAIQQMTGKYPAINAFDYVHLNSSPTDWIDYGDISPVKDWADLGGIVAAGWHWNVPTSNPDPGTPVIEDKEDEIVDIDDVVIGAWNAVAAFAPETFADCVVGGTLVFYYENAADNAQIGLRRQIDGWPNLLDGKETDFSYIGLPAGSGTFVVDIDAVVLAEIKTHGLIAGGQFYTITKLVKTWPSSEGPTIDFPDQVIENWGAWVSFTPSDLAAVTLGTVMHFHYINAADNGQMAFKSAVDGWPGMVDGDGNDYGYFSIPAGDGEYELTVDATILADFRANGLILTGQFYTPTHITLDIPAEPLEVAYSFYSDINEFNPVDALDTESWMNKYLLQDLDEIAADLLLLQDAGIAVLFRPLHEASGGWFWWGTRTGDDFVALWRYVFDYLTGKGVHNLLWVWTSCLNDAEWYPGDAYVDFIGTDWYPSKEEEFHTSYSEGWEALLQISNHKMLTLSECGPIPDMGACLEDGTMWIWAMPWYGDHMKEPYNDETFFKAWMASSYVEKISE